MTSSSSTDFPTGPACLLVPIQVEALVIDDKPGQTNHAGLEGEKTTLHWVPPRTDYRQTLNLLFPPGPGPFFGAPRNAAPCPQRQPTLKDRGVYLRWELPAGLRHAYAPPQGAAGAPDFPALPDQWLVLRFLRRGHEPGETRAWFIDSSAIAADVTQQTDSGPSANLLHIGLDTDKNPVRQAVRAGRVFSVDAHFSLDALNDCPARVKLNALGTDATGSASFTAHVAENLNLLSWHDDLGDLFGEDGRTPVPPDTGLSYQVIGWYASEQDSPLRFVARRLADTEARTPQAVLSALGWQIPAEDDAPSVFGQDFPEKGPCLFHGMVAHINYWNPALYRGGLLGYPGSPLKHGGNGTELPPVKVGLGISIADALSSLAAQGRNTQGEAPHYKEPSVWEALEALFHGQTDTLLRGGARSISWQRRHQEGFLSHEAGTVWHVSAPESEKTRSDAATPTPPAALLAALEKLNAAQARVDADARTLAVAQRRFYQRWWPLIQLSRRGKRADEHNHFCAQQAEHIRALKETLARSTEELARAAITDAQLNGFTLRHAPAPRYWTAADPVIVVRNLAQPDAPPSGPLPCRFPHHRLHTLRTQLAFPALTICQEALRLPERFGARGPLLQMLVHEALTLEHAMAVKQAASLSASLSGASRFEDEKSWRAWLDRHTKNERLEYQTATGQRMHAATFARFWKEQPWSPLFLDWRLTWHPAPDDNTPKNWQWSNSDYRFKDENSQSAPEDSTDVIQRRSLLTPIDNDALKKPVEALLALIGKGAPLSRYDASGWRAELEALQHDNLLGLSLAGLGAWLDMDDTRAPRIRPDAITPWMPPRKEPPQKKLMDERLAQETLSTASTQGIKRPGLPPPLPPLMEAIEDERKPASTRAGWFTLDELWVADSFGQWADLLHGAAMQGASFLEISPPLRCSHNVLAIAQPPRFTRPARLDFDFCARPEQTDPIAGWALYAPLDRALVISDAAGKLLGELFLEQEGDSLNPRWEAIGNTGIAQPENIPHPSLRGFVTGLMAADAQTDLMPFFALIQTTLDATPVATTGEAMLLHPLVLADACLGVDFYGQDSPAGLPAIAVHLGGEPDDGLVGFFLDDDFRHLAPSPGRATMQPGGYLAPLPARAPCAVARHVTLLMTPETNVQAATGYFPVKRLQFPPEVINPRLERLEYALRTGPALLPGDTLPILPTPVAVRREWLYLEAQPGATPQDIAPFETRPRFQQTSCYISEGRLLLKQAPTPPSSGKTDRSPS